MNISVSQGEFVAITGPSGSGKSTLLHLAGLLDHPSSGRVIFDGQDVSTLEELDLCRLRKQKIGMVFQKYCLLPHRSILGNVLFRFRYLDDDRADAHRRSVQALDTMGLMKIANRPARLLSGGEMQRVAIARSVALVPRLLLADEPTGNLDQSSANTVMECFRNLNQEGMTILMVTHNEALLDFCTHHFVCQAGSIKN
jgi:putative ABC transport system ATP-binding protein